MKQDGARVLVPTADTDLDDLAFVSTPGCPAEGPSLGCGPDHGEAHLEGGPRKVGRALCGAGEVEHDTVAKKSLRAPDAHDEEALIKASAKSTSQTAAGTTNPENCTSCESELSALWTPPGLGHALVGFSVSSLAAAALARVPSDSGDLLATVVLGGVAVAVFFSLVSASFIVRTVRGSLCNGGGSADDAHGPYTASSGSFKLPLMPLIPMMGIVVNCVLLSEMPVISLVRTACVYVATAALYVVYAAPSAEAAAVRVKNSSSPPDDAQLASGALGAVIGGENDTDAAGLRGVSASN